MVIMMMIAELKEHKMKQEMKKMTKLEKDKNKEHKEEDKWCNEKE